MMPADGPAQMREHDAILLGAVGLPEVPDHVSLWGMLIPLRRELRQYVNLRPVRLLRGVRTPLADRRPEEIDFIIVRENNEGEYSRIGGRIYEGTDDEIVVQETVFTRRGVDRIIRYAFELARRRPRRHLTSATKSNGIYFTMPFWDERFAAIASEYARYFHGKISYRYSRRRILFSIPIALMLWSARICSAIFFPILARRWLARSVWPRRPISIPSENFRRCLSPCMVRRPISPERASPIRLRKSGRRR